MHRTILMMMLCVALIVPCAAATTLHNLQMAYGNERSAHTRYLAFAEKAEQEHYPCVASLFRAAAQAEEIHAGNHAELIAKMGAVPSTNIEPIVVKSTAENLQTAIRSEIHERDTMYPEFLRVARDENADNGVLRTFNYAREAEAQHAKLFIEALQNLPSLKNLLETYYVCPVCGFTTTRLDFERCPECAHAKSEFIAVSTSS
jgi:rubrerythrin